MPDLRSHPHWRRYFYPLVGLAIVAIISIRFFVLPHYTGQKIPSALEIFDSILDRLLVAMAASLAVALVVDWFIPPATKTETMGVVEPNLIRETLQKALERTGEWSYRGHSGRHFRSVTLPKLAQDAKARSVGIQISLQILNPTNLMVCQKYADYRRSLSSAEHDAEWTAQRARKELIATIISAYAWKARVPSLDIKIALIDTLSLFRVDLSSRLALVTKEAKQEPALRFNEGTAFYAAYREDLRFTFEQATPLPKVGFVPLEQVDKDNTKQLLGTLGFEALDLSEAEIQDILSTAKAAKNPYA